MNIDGLSVNTIEFLLENNLIKTYKDIYYLEEHKDFLLNSEGFKETKVNNILSAIENSRNCKLSNFIISLGIPLVGTSVSKLIEKKCGSYETFRDYVMDDTFNFTDWEGIGPEINNALKRFDYTEADYIYEKVLKIFSKKDEYVEYPSLDGKRFAITGSINYGRGKLSEFIEKCGGTVTSSVSKKMRSRMERKL